MKKYFLYSAFLAMVGVFSVTDMVRATSVDIPCAAPDQSKKCGYHYVNETSFGWPYSTQCFMSGSDIYNGNRILAGQVCGFGGTPDDGGYYMVGTGEPNPSVSVTPYGAGLPPGWTYAKTGSLPSTIPTGEFTDSAYYNYRFFSGNVTINSQPAGDDENTLRIGSLFSYWTGCYADVRDVQKSGCPASQNMTLVNQTFTANPGDALAFSVRNDLRPNNGYGQWADGNMTMRLNNITVCYTAVELARLGGYQNIVTYHPTAEGTCTPEPPVCSPVTQTADANQNVTFSATGGGGNYSWSGGDSPATGSGSSFTTSFSTSGSKTVTVTSTGQSDTCSVTVNSTPTPTPTPVAKCDGVYDITSTLSCADGSTCKAGSYKTCLAGPNNTAYWSECTNFPTAGTSCGTTTACSCSGTNNSYTCDGAGTCDTNTNSCTPPNTCTSSLSVSPEPIPVACGATTGTATVTANYSGLYHVTANGTDTSGPINGGSWSAIENWVSNNMTWNLIRNSDNVILQTATSHLQPACGPVCSPSSQSVGVNANASLSASSGDGTYAWSAPGGSPSSGSGSNFSVQYGTAGTKTVSVSSNGQTADCSVNVTTTTTTTLPPGTPVLSLSNTTNFARNPGFWVGDNWSLNLTSTYPNQSLDICATKNGVSLGCTPFGSTNNGGGWSMTGSFDSSTIGSWVEWARINGSVLSNTINFTISTVGSTTTTTTSSPTPTPTQSVSCSPDQYSKTAGSYFTITGNNCGGACSFTSFDASPSSGYGTWYYPSYSTTGLKTIYVSRPSYNSGLCQVNVTAPPTNLTISNFHFTDASGTTKSTFNTGESIYPYVTITNNGTVATSGSFYISVYSNMAGTAAVGTASDVGVFVTESNSIPAGGNKTYSVTTNSAYWSSTSYTLSSAGTFTGRAFVDSYNGVAETNESDNQATTSYTVNAVPTLTTSLTAAPSSGYLPSQDVNLSASVGGSATGTVNYSFWWNCNNASTNLATLAGACGSLPSPGVGSCLGNANGYKCVGVNTIPQTATHNYTSSATAKVVVERGISPNAESRASITLTPPPLSVALSASPSSGRPNQSVNLTATVSGNAVGTINYSFWWNCNNALTDVATVSSVCGALPLPASGSCAGNANGFKCLAVNMNPGVTANSYYASSTTTFTPKVIVERGAGLPTESRASVIITENPPVTSNVVVTPPDYCSSGPAATITWNYSDADGDLQSAYQVQIDDGSNTWAAYDSGKVSNAGTSTFVSGLAFNKTYRARVRVWDSFDSASAWTTSASWSAPRHAYPFVNFAWQPLNPSAGQSMKFTDNTTYYDNGSSGTRTWSWNFGDAGTSAKQNPLHTYANQGSYNVTFIPTDKDGFSCSISNVVNILTAEPAWKEVSPK